ncbi:TAXI family TRAP transporter solute-binding subunit [Gammaproteobacteria bacterium]|nr:TAXI family TRAP transporter solute-binding subunit [Gammaproteobacteria bacterium]
MTQFKLLKTPLAYLCFAGLVAILQGCATPAINSASTQLSVGTGGKTGNYYRTGTAFCRVVNEHVADTDIACAASPSNGSVANLRLIGSGDMDLGVAESRWLRAAWEGKRQFAQAGANADLRALFAFYSEPLMVVVSRDSDISTLADLRDHHVVTIYSADAYETLRSQASLDLPDAQPLKSAQARDAFCGGRADAIVYSSGQPSVLVSELVDTCRGVVIDIDKDIIDAVAKERPDMRATTIPAGLYSDHDVAIQTIGYSAVLVTRKDIEAETIYRLVKSLFENVDRFDQLRPDTGSASDPQIMISGISVPLHRGAERYYRERGWLSGE